MWYKKDERGCRSGLISAIHICGVTEMVSSEIDEPKVRVHVEGKKDIKSEVD